MLAIPLERDLHGMDRLAVKVTFHGNYMVFGCGISREKYTCTN